MRKYIIGIITVVIISIFFLSYMPTYENDFEKTKREFQSGDLKLYTNIANISKEHYLRPEFYTSYDNYKNVKEQKGTYGYGAQPSEVSYNVTKFKKGQYLDVYTFVISSYDVGNYQGIRLILKSPDDELFETRTDPTDILLHPVILGSPENQSEWAYKIKARVIAKKDIPEGKYTFRLMPGLPSSEKQEEFQNIVRNMNGTYVNIGPIRPTEFFDFILYEYN